LEVNIILTGVTWRGCCLGPWPFLWLLPCENFAVFWPGAPPVCARVPCPVSIISKYVRGGSSEAREWPVSPGPTREPTPSRERPLEGLTGPREELVSPDRRRIFGELRAREQLELIERLEALEEALDLPGRCGGWPLPSGGRTRDLWGTAQRPRSRTEVDGRVLLRPVRDLRLRTGARPLRACERRGALLRAFGAGPNGLAYLSWETDRTRQDTRPPRVLASRRPQTGLARL
jgi:hypothetical protein